MVVVVRVVWVVGVVAASGSVFDGDGDGADEVNAEANAPIQRH